MKLNEDFYKESEGKTVYSQNISSKQLHITDSGHVSVDFISISRLRKASKIAILGDSVARGLRAKYGFGDILKDRTNAAITNLSVSGVNMSNNGTDNIYQQSLKRRAMMSLLCREQMMIGAAIFPSAQMKRISPHFTEASVRSFSSCEAEIKTAASLW